MTRRLCANHESYSHDVFLSYRQHSDKHFTQNLAFQLERRNHPVEKNVKIKAFIDSFCLTGGFQWQEGFLSGLVNSKVIVLVISESALEGVVEADSKPDNMLLEWEYALDLYEQKKAAIFPLFVGKIKHQEGDELYKKFNVRNALDLERFPDVLHRHPKSSNMKRTIRQVIETIGTIQGLFVDPSTPRGVVGEIIKRLELFLVEEGSHDESESMRSQPHGHGASSDFLRPPVTFEPNDDGTPHTLCAFMSGKETLRIVREADHRNPVYYIETVGGLAGDAWEALLHQQTPEGPVLLKIGKNPSFDDLYVKGNWNSMILCESSSVYSFHDPTGREFEWRKQDLYDANGKKVASIEQGTRNSKVTYTLKVENDVLGIMDLVVLTGLAIRQWVNAQIGLFAGKRGSGAERDAPASPMQNKRKIPVVKSRGDEEDESEEEEDESEEEEDEDDDVLCHVEVIKKFTAKQKNEFTIKKGDTFKVIKKGSDGFWLARNVKGVEKWIPSANVKVTKTVDSAIATPEDSDEDEDDEDEDEDHDDDDDVICKVTVTKKFVAKQDNEFTIKKGQTYKIIRKGKDGFWLARNERGVEKWIPKANVEVMESEDEDDDDDDDDDDDEDEDEEDDVLCKVEVTKKFVAKQKNEFTIKKGETYKIIKKGSDGFWLARNEKGVEKWIPKTHVKVIEDDSEDDDEEEDEDEESEEKSEKDDGGVICRVWVTKKFKAKQSNEFSINKGDELDIIKKGSDGFWLARNEDGDEKWIPSTHVEVKNKSNTESDDEEDGQDFETLLEEARKGGSGAYAPIAQKYYEGDGCNADPKKAMMYAKKAIAAKADLTKKDVALANSVIGHCYYYGEGVEIDRKRSLKYIKIASEGGIAASQKLYGIMHYYGSGGAPKDQMIAQKWLLAAHEGLPEDTLIIDFLSMSYFDSEEWGEAFKYAAILEKKGVGKFGAFKLGFCYLWGYAEDGEDNDKAVECFKQAIEERGTDWQQATYWLGRCYYSGWGVEADKRKAREKFEAVADEVPYASAYLGYMNFYGTAGFTTDMAEARRLFKVAIDAPTSPKSPRESVLAHHGVAAYRTELYDVAFKSLVAGCAEDFEFGPAYLCLAEAYYLGHGTEKDFGKVKEFALKVIEKEDELSKLELGRANWLLGELYYLGKKVEQDRTQARKYFQKSADAGDPMGKAMLGIMYYYGTGGLDEDEDKATKLLADALSDTTNWNNTNDKLDASAHLGVLYNNEANYDEAFPLLLESGTANFTITYAKIALCYCYGRGTKQDYKMAEKWAEKTVEEEKTSSVAKGDGYAILGLTRYWGWGRKKDLVAARTYFEKGCEVDDPKCKEILGIMHYFGTGGAPKDHRRAKQLLTEGLAKVPTMTDAKKYLAEIEGESD